MYIEYLRHPRGARADGLRALAPPDEGGCARRGALALARVVCEVGTHGAHRGAPAGIVTVIVAVVVMVIVIVVTHSHNDSSDTWSHMIVARSTHTGES